jgi:hypothetical protein
LHAEPIASAPHWNNPVYRFFRDSRRRLRRTALRYDLKAARAGFRPVAKAAVAATCAMGTAAAFSETIRTASRCANAPPVASRIRRNAITHCTSHPNWAASNNDAHGFAIAISASY